MKHLETTVNLFNNDIKTITQQTKSQFIHYNSSQHQILAPVDNNDNTTNLNFDIRQLFAAIGNKLIKKQLISEFGFPEIAKQLFLFFT